MMNNIEDLKYIEVDEYSTQSVVKIDDVKTFLEILSEFQPNFIMVKKLNFLKYMFNMSKESRAALIGKPYPTFSMESFGYEFRDKTNSDIDYGIKGPIIEKVKAGVWKLCSSDPNYDPKYHDTRLTTPKFDYKIVDKGEELEVYQYLDIVKDGEIEKLTEFIIIHGQVAYILTEHNALSDKIDLSSKGFGHYKEDESLNVPHKSSSISEGEKGSMIDINHDISRYESYPTFGGRSGKGNPRADVFNPNNPAHKDAGNNRSNQMNPNNPAYHKGRRRK